MAVGLRYILGERIRPRIEAIVARVKSELSCASVGPKPAAIG